MRPGKVAAPTFFLWDLDNEAKENIMNGNSF